MKIENILKLSYLLLTLNINLADWKIFMKELVLKYSNVRKRNQRCSSLERLIYLAKIRSCEYFFDKLHVILKDINVYNL